METLTVNQAEIEKLNNIFNSKSSPFATDESVKNRIISNIDKITSILDDTQVDIIIKNELGKNYPTLAPLVKDRLYAPLPFSFLQ